MRKDLFSKDATLRFKLSKAIILSLVFLFVSFQGWGQTLITPQRSTVSGFPTWTDVDILGSTYIQLLKSTSSTVTPAMDFDAYTNETLDFTARTFGGSSVAENIITVSISTNNGLNWTVLGTRTPSSTTLTSQLQFDLSGYSGTQVRLKFSVSGTNDGVGSGIASIDIKGNAITCTSPTTQASTFTSSSITQTTATAGWTRGNGTGGVLVLARAGSAVNADPTSGSNYTANATFGSGDQIGTGNYVVYKGTGTSVNLTALT